MKYLDFLSGHQVVFKGQLFCNLVRVTMFTNILNLFWSSIAVNKERQREGGRGGRREGR